MQNEIRFYLNLIKSSMEAKGANDEPAFSPSYIVTAVKLPTGAIELAVNNQNIADKIEYILDAYDDDMRLKTNTDIQMQNIMVV